MEKEHTETQQELNGQIQGEIQEQLNQDETTPNSASVSFPDSSRLLLSSFTTIDSDFNDIMNSSSSLSTSSIVLELQNWIVDVENDMKMREEKKKQRKQQEKKRFQQQQQQQLEQVEMEEKLRILIDQQQQVQIAKSFQSSDRNPPPSLNNDGVDDGNDQNISTVENEFMTENNKKEDENIINDEIHAKYTQKDQLDTTKQKESIKKKRPSSSKKPVIKSQTKSDISVTPNSRLDSSTSLPDSLLPDLSSNPIQSTLTSSNSSSTVQSRRNSIKDSLPTTEKSTNHIQSQTEKKSNSKTKTNNLFQSQKPYLLLHILSMSPFVSCL